MREALRRRRRDNQRHQRKQHCGRSEGIDEHPHACLLQLDHQGSRHCHGLLFQLEWQEDARKPCSRYRIPKGKTQIQGI